MMTITWAQLMTALISAVVPVLLHYFTGVLPSVSTPTPKPATTPANKPVLALIQLALTQLPPGHPVLAEVGQTLLAALAKQTAPTPQQGHTP